MQEQKLNPQSKNTIIRKRGGLQHTISLLRRWKETFLSIYHAKTVSEMLQKIPWGFVSFLAWIPMLLFTLAPLYQLVYDSLFPPSASMLEIGMVFYTYPYTIQTVSIVAAILGFLVILIYCAKTAQRHLNCRVLLREHLPMLFFGVFLILMLISVCINGFTDAVVYGDSYRNESLWTYLLYFLFYYFCATLLCRNRHLKMLFGCFLAVSVILGIAVLLDIAGVEIPAFIQSVGTSAVFHQFNHYGYFLLFSILLSSGLGAVTKKRWLRLCCAAAFVLNLVVLILNDTFGCYLAVFLALVFQCVWCSVIQRKCSILSLAFLAGFVLVSAIMTFWTDTVFTNLFTFIQDLGKIAADDEDANRAGTGRWNLWVNTVQYIRARPLFGWGIEGIHDRLMEAAGNNRPHNEYLQYAVFFGIPAAIVYIAGLFAAFADSWKRRNTLDIFSVTASVCAFGYLVSAFFGNTMYYTAPWLFLFLGIMGRREIGEQA